MGKRGRSRVKECVGWKHLFLHCLSLPLRSMARGAGLVLFIHNAGSRYSCGTGPGCGRLKRVRKEQHAGPELSDGWPREERDGLNLITLVTLTRLVLLSLPALAKEIERKERRQAG